MVQANFFGRWFGVYDDEIQKGKFAVIKQVSIADLFFIFFKELLKIGGFT